MSHKFVPDFSTWKTWSFGCILIIAAAQKRLAYNQEVFNMKNSKTKNMTTMAMLAALAFLVMVVGRIPMVAAAPFLKYDPKDVIIIFYGAAVSQEEVAELSDFLQNEYPMVDVGFVDGKQEIYDFIISLE